MVVRGKYFSPNCIAQRQQIQTVFFYDKAQGSSQGQGNMHRDI